MRRTAFRLLAGTTALAVLTAFGAAVPDDATPTEAVLSGCGLALLAFGGLFAGVQFHLAVGAPSEGADDDRDRQGEHEHEQEAVGEVVD